MSIHQLNFNGKDKVQVAIDRLKAATGLMDAIVPKMIKGKRHEK